MKISGTTLLLFASVLGGCAQKSDPDGGDTGTNPAASGEELPSIPDPGTDFAPLRWYDDGGYHGTPETAQVMGIVLDVPHYIQGGIDPETQNHYFVFRTFEDQTEFSVDLFDKSSEIAHVHVHDGTDLLFGEEIEPISVTSPVTAEWELEGDHIYVLEVHSPVGGFF